VTIKESLKGPTAISSFVVSIVKPLLLTAKERTQTLSKSTGSFHQTCEHTVCRVSSPLEAYFNGEALAIAVLLRAAVADYV
jgi:hypothetical protein